MSKAKVKKKKLKNLPGQETFKGFKSYLDATNKRMGEIHLSVSAKGVK